MCGYRNARICLGMPVMEVQASHIFPAQRLAAAAPSPTAPNRHTPNGEASNGHGNAGEVDWIPRSETLSRETVCSQIVTINLACTHYSQKRVSAIISATCWF